MSRLKHHSPAGTKPTEESVYWNNEEVMLQLLEEREERRRFPSVHDDLGHLVTAGWFYSKWGSSSEDY